MHTHTHTYMHDVLHYATWYATIPIPGNDIANFPLSLCRDFVYLSEHHHTQEYQWHLHHHTLHNISSMHRRIETIHWNRWLCLDLVWITSKNARGRPASARYCIPSKTRGEGGEEEKFYDGLPSGVFLRHDFPSHIKTQTGHQHCRCGISELWSRHVPNLQCKWTVECGVEERKRVLPHTQPHT